MRHLGGMTAERIPGGRHSDGMTAERTPGVRHPGKVEWRRRGLRGGDTWMEWRRGGIPGVIHPDGMGYATRRKGDLLRVQRAFIFSNKADSRAHASVNIVGTKQLCCTKVRMDVVVRIVWKSRERNGYRHGGVKRKI